MQYAQNWIDWTSHRERDDAEARPVGPARGGLHVDAVVAEVVGDVLVVLEREVYLRHQLVQAQARVVRGERLPGHVPDHLREALRVEHLYVCFVVLIMYSYTYSILYGL